MDAKGEQEFCELTSKNDVCARYNLLSEIFSKILMN